MSSVARVASISLIFQAPVGSSSELGNAGTSGAQSQSGHRWLPSRRVCVAHCWACVGAQRKEHSGASGGFAGEEV